MDEIKLKPCPFCGGKGILNNGEYNLESFVKCSTCGAETSRVAASTKYCSDEKVIEAWNRRTENG